MDWLAQRSLHERWQNQDPPNLVIKTDESKPYYWLYIQQGPRLPTQDSPWTAVQASYDRASGDIRAAVTDTVRAVGLGFNLPRMGLDSTSRYVVLTRDMRNGDSDMGYVQPVGGWLKVSSPAAGEYQLTIYPETESRHLAVLEQVTDTFLDTWNQSSINDTQIRLEISQGDRAAPLVRFDVSSMPHGARIISAAVRYYVVNAINMPTPLPIEVRAYKVNRPWVASEANWLQAQRGQPWSMEGCNRTGPDQDRDGAATGSFTIKAVNTWINLDVTSAMQAWVDDPAQNHGVVLKSPGDRRQYYYQLASAEYADVSRRPELYVVYDYVEPSPTVTPTATASPTATTSPTPNETPTPTAIPTPSPTATPQGTATPAQTPTPIVTPTSTATATPSQTPRFTPTHTPTASATPNGYRLYLPIITSWPFDS
jgi:hypothetical protein